MTVDMGGKGFRCASAASSQLLVCCPPVSLFHALGYDSCHRKRMIARIVASCLIPDVFFLIALSALPSTRLTAPPSSTPTSPSAPSSACGRALSSLRSPVRISCLIASACRVPHPPFSDLLPAQPAPPFLLAAPVLALSPPPPFPSLSAGRQQAAAGMGIYGPRTVYVIAIAGAHAASLRTPAAPPLAARALHTVAPLPPRALRSAAVADSSLPPRFAPPAQGSRARTSSSSWTTASGCT